MTRKYANPDEIAMLMYIAATKGMPAATAKANRMGFPIAVWEEEE